MSKMILPLARYLCEFLEEHGFRVVHTDSVASAISYLSVDSFDLILLDLKLPDFDGFEVLRKVDSGLPVIVMSAISDTHSKVKAFRYGATDYLVKPIDLPELEARIWSHLRRHGRLPDRNESATPKRIFYIENGQLYHNEEIVDFTPVEFEIFQHLLENANRTVSREQLASALSSLSSHRTLDYHIKNIRQKIGDTGKKPRFLKTEYGIGYKLVV